jgi:AmiR/NasT family two-component response regulator
LGLFGATTGSLDADDHNLAQALAHVASIAILQQGHATTKTPVIPGLQAAVASRRDLELAKGVLAEIYQIDMQEAVARLRLYAHAREMHLSDVARGVVTEAGQQRGALIADLDEASPASRT